jgi:monoamine oxidase
MAGLNKAVHEYQLETSSKVGVARYNRRTFIQQSTKGAIGVGVALSLPAMLISCKQETRPPQGVEQDPVLDVAILGGGMAGLNCANHLLGSGLTFKVYEGSKRVGGRILTHYMDSMQLGIFPEFGGDFIDSDHEDMIKLAKEFNLDLVDQIAEQEANQWVKDIYFFDNRKISEKEIIREFKKIAPKIAKDRDALGENYDTPEASRMDKMSLSEYLDSLKCKEWMKELLDAAFVAEFGLDCSEQSAINMLDLIITDTSEGFKVFGTSDERYRIKGGNSQITNKLAEKIGEDNILKNYKVTEISEGDNGMYTIVFENGEKVEAKVIVCTIPFTILREIKLSLKGMTPEKRKCIDELGYGINTKLVLGYEGQPWRSKENNAMGYLFTKDMTNGWDASLNRTENNENGAYVAFFGGKFSQSLCDESSRNPMSPPEHVWRTMLPEKRVNGFVDDLDKIFIRSKKKFKGKHVFVNWIEYPFVKASYACYKTGQWTTIAGHEAKPVGNFYFAGEHCSNNFQGFMNGAAESGRETAIQLIEKYAKVPVN